MTRRLAGLRQSFSETPVDEMLQLTSYRAMGWLTCLLARAVSAPARSLSRCLGHGVSSVVSGNFSPPPVGCILCCYQAELL